MKVLVHKKVVAGTLTDDPEVVYKGFLKTNRAAEVVAGDTGRLVFGPSGKASTTNTLRVIHDRKTETAAGRKCHMEQIVQVPGEFDILPGASSSAGHKDQDVNWERTAYRERIGGC